MASEQVCQALTGCVNALGQHNRRCPAAPSEPPAADSPTPGTCGEWVVTRRCARPVGHEGWHRNGDQASGAASYVAPSPVDATEPPAETQKDDERRWNQVLWLRIREAFWAAGLAALDSDVAHVAEGVEQYVTERLAARPSADTETLRRVREIATDWLSGDDVDAATVLAREILGVLGVPR